MSLSRQSRIARRNSSTASHADKDGRASTEALLEQLALLQTKAHELSAHVEELRVTLNQMIEYNRRLRKA
jgi:hypothetical protein